MSDPSPVGLTREIEDWLDDWVGRNDAGPDFTDDETLAVFDFIAELRKFLASGGSPPSLPAEPSREALMAAQAAYRAPWPLENALRAAYRTDSDG